MGNQTRIGSGPDATASSVLAWPAMGIASSRGLPIGRLAREAGLEVDALADSSARVPLRAVQQFWRLTAERLSEPHLGLSSLVELGASSSASWPDPVALYEILFSSSPTLGQGIDLVSRYVRILRDGFSAYIYDRDGRASLRFDFADEDPPALIQLHVGMVVLMKRRTLPDVPCVSEVWLTESRPADVVPYERFFGVPVRFAAPYDGLLSDVPLWDEPLPTADEQRNSRAQWRAGSLLAKLPDPERVSDRVRLVVRASLPDGDLRVESVAKQLAVSSRTLHRRLSQEGETFQGLLDEARQQLAMRELASSGRPVRDVGQLVGFRNVSAFHRAFKGWTGLTPSEFRERHAPRVRSER